MKLSIIIPVLNVEKYISKAIESIQNQSFKNWELIVVDDGCTDKTEEIVQRFMEKDGRIKFIPTKKNVGISAAINKGIKIAKGDIIGYLGADDWYDKDVFSDVIIFFEQHPEIMWIYGDSYNVYNMPNGETREIKLTPLVQFDYQKMLGGNYIGLQNVFFRKALFEKVGLFDPKILYATDYEFWLRIGRDFIPKKLSRVISYNLQDENYSSIKRREQCWDALKLSWRYSCGLKEKLKAVKYFLRFIKTFLPSLPKLKLFITRRFKA